MNKIKNWYLTYQNEITWWVIGWLSFSSIDSLSRGHYIMSIIAAGLAYFNYYMWRNNRV